MLKTGNRRVYEYDFLNPSVGFKMRADMPITRCGYPILSSSWAKLATACYRSGLRQPLD